MKYQPIQVDNCVNNKMNFKYCNYKIWIQSKYYFIKCDCKYLKYNPEEDRYYCKKPKDKKNDN